MPVEAVFAFNCQGLQLKAPAPAFQTDGRFTLLFNITRKGIWNVDNWCHDPAGELFDLDPRVIFQDEEKRKKILEKMSGA